MELSYEICVVIFLFVNFNIKYLYKILLIIKKILMRELSSLVNFKSQF
jgi:hypothetical protein